MQLKEVINQLSLQILNPEPPNSTLEAKVTGITCGDLLSYIVANAREGHLWLTIQNHQNVIAVASLLGLSAVVITGGFRPDETTLSKAQQEEVILLGTHEKTYEVAGQLHRLNL